MWGSTKLACYLIDLKNGKLLAAKGRPQSADLYTARTSWRAWLMPLRRPGRGSTTCMSWSSRVSTRQQGDMCREIGIPPDSIVDACLVGKHRHAPFLFRPAERVHWPCRLSSPPQPARSTHPPNKSACAVWTGMGIYVPGVIAGFVGSDHLAFLLACGFGEETRIRLGIDIGTNTEIALQKGSHVVSVSHSFRPGLRGRTYPVRYACGARRDRAHAHPCLMGRSSWTSLERSPQPASADRGNSGTRSEKCIPQGLLNGRGRLERSHPLVEINASGKPFITLLKSENGKSVTLSQNDIDQVLLAKGAIRAGIEVLMDHLQVQPEELEEIVIAGAFGSFMAPAQAVRIGMLPDVPLERIRAVGNAAGYGARMMLVSKKARLRAEELAREIEYLELNLYPDFDLIYARSIRA